MVTSAGKDFAHTLRGGFAAACELASLSALGVSLAALMWTVLTPKGELGSPSSSSVTPVDDQSEIVATLSQTADPFATNVTLASTAVSDANGFTLHATRAWGDGDGTAIISASGGQQEAFAVGEEVTPGVILSSVATDHVEIDVGGRRMRIAFPGAASPMLAQATTRLPADFQAAAQSIPALSALPLQPVSRNGQPSGFEVMPQADSVTLAAAGLHVGDIVLSINGVDAATADLSAYRNQLTSGQPVEIRFERNGQIHTTRLGIQ